MIPYAAVLTHNRPEMAKNLVDKLVTDGIRTFVIDHDSETPFRHEGRAVHLMQTKLFSGEDFNISILWNTLLYQIENWHYDIEGMTDFCVTVFNDDADPSPGFCETMAWFMERHHLDIVSAGSQELIRREDTNRPIPLEHRPQGWAWTVRGWGIRVDESMRVWYSDDDLWQQALTGRGFGLTTAASCGNLDANGHFGRNPWWQEQAGRDRATFVQKWGFEPW